MSKFTAVLLSALVFSSAATRADEAQTAQEIRELKSLIEQQMKRIDELTIQIGRLHQAIEAQKAAIAPAPEPKREVVGPPPYSGITELSPRPTQPRPEAAKAEAPASPEEPAPDAPKAEAVNGIRHLVAKGETLTSIAKRYNVSVGDLQKANKGVNDRKLQIGQTLIVPATRPPESTSDQTKENP
jgi:LysM repeat protein